MNNFSKTLVLLVSGCCWLSCSSSQNVDAKEGLAIEVICSNSRPADNDERINSYNLGKKALFFSGSWNHYLGDKYERYVHYAPIDCVECDYIGFTFAEAQSHREPVFFPELTEREVANTTLYTSIFYSTDTKVAISTNNLSLLNVVQPVLLQCFSQ